MSISQRPECGPNRHLRSYSGSAGKLLKAANRCAQFATTAWAGGAGKTIGDGSDGGDGGQVEPPFASGDVGQVGQPDLVGRLGGEVAAEPVECDRIPWRLSVVRVRRGSAAALAWGSAPPPPSPAPRTASAIVEAPSRAGPARRPPCQPRDRCCDAINRLSFEGLRKDPTRTTHQTLLSRLESLAWVSTKPGEDQPLTFSSKMRSQPAFRSASS